MTVPSDPPGRAEATPYEPFYDHRVPPYACPACPAGVLLLERETLHMTFPR